MLSPCCVRIERDEEGVEVSTFDFLAPSLPSFQRDENGKQVSNFHYFTRIISSLPSFHPPTHTCSMCTDTFCKVSAWRKPMA